MTSKEVDNNCSKIRCHINSATFKSCNIPLGECKFYTKPQTKVFRIRLTEEEYAFLSQAERVEGISKTSVIKEALIKYYRGIFY